MATTNAKGLTLTKADLARVKANEAKMTGEQRRAVSKALVEANTAANTMATSRRRKKA